MKKTRDDDCDELIAKLKHKVTMGVDVEGNPRVYFFKDMIEWDDAKRFMKMVRLILNDHFKRVTNGWNCPVRGDDPVEPEVVPEGTSLLNYIVIGTETVNNPTRDVIRCVVPDETEKMKGLANHLERLINVVDCIMASRFFR